jgi:hypothetical protein
MIGLKLTLKGTEETASALATTKNDLPPELRDGLQTDAFPIYFALADYPPTVPGSKYVRTFAYRNAITVDVKVMSYGAELQIEQGDKASPWLRGDPDTGQRQAAIHVGRWQTVTAILAKFVPVVVARVNRRAEAFLARVWRT